MYNSSDIYTYINNSKCTLTTNKSEYVNICDYNIITYSVIMIWYAIFLGSGAALSLLHLPDMFPVGSLRLIYMYTRKFIFVYYDYLKIFLQ